MKIPRTLLAISTGALAGLTAGAIPLWRQQKALATLPPAQRSPASASPSKVQSQEPAAVRGKHSDTQIQAAEMVSNFTADQCRAALDEELTKGDKTKVSALLCRWATLDGKAAFDWLLVPEHDLGGGLDDLAKFEDFYSIWAFSDPSGFAATIEKKGLSLEPGKRHPFALTCFQWLRQHDLRAAIRLGGNMSQDSQLGMPITRMDLQPAIRSVADLQAVGAEILAHPEWTAPYDNEKPLYLLVALRECWQDMDPDDWDRWAAAHPNMAEKSDNGPMNPGLRFLRSAERAAAANEIFATMPPEQLERNSAELLKLWNDPEATGHWLNAQPDGPVKNAAAQAYALAFAREDPQAAFHWADAITDPAARARTQRRVFTAWHVADPAAASAWLPQSGWEPAQQQAARDIMVASPAAAVTAIK